MRLEVATMAKNELTQLILKHDEEISQLKVSTGQMMLLWKIVGTVSLVAVGVWLKTLTA